MSCITFFLDETDADHGNSTFGVMEWFLDSSHGHGDGELLFGFVFGVYDRFGLDCVLRFSFSGVPRFPFF